VLTVAPVAWHSGAAQRSGASRRSEALDMVRRRWSSAQRLMVKMACSRIEAARLARWPSVVALGVE
jgi:hypothetical protein